MIDLGEIELTKSTQITYKLPIDFTLRFILELVLQRKLRLSTIFFKSIIQNCKGSPSVLNIYITPHV